MSTTPLDVAARVLAMAEADDILVAATHRRAGLTRFAESFVHQHVGEDATAVSLTVMRDGRVASATTSDVTDEGLRGLVRRAQELATAAPIDHDWPGVSDATQAIDPGHVAQDTLDAQPGDRTAIVKAFVETGGANAAGYCDTEVSTSALVTSAGAAFQQRSTRATLDGIHRLPSGAAGSGHATSTSLGDLDGAHEGAGARHLADLAERTVALEPGRLPVLLSPEAAATLAIFLSAYGFNGKAHREGQSAIQLGEAQFDDDLTLVDDPLGPTGLGIGFDGEGTPRRELALIDSGVTMGLAHDRRTGAAAGSGSTGHGGPGSARFGPVAANLSVRPGSDLRPAPVADLVAEIERGLWITAFNYCRILDPKTLAVTGLTRNGTFLVEDGHVVGSVGNIRFTQSFAQAVAPGHLLGMGDDARHADSEFGPGMTHVPSLLLAQWNITGDGRG